MAAKSQWDKLDISNKLDDIEQWCRDGVIEKDICHNLGVGVTTFNQWKLDHGEIIETLKRGKLVADQVVVSKLYQRAIGFTYDEVKKETVQDADGNELNVFKVTTTTKYVNPDVTACIYWTKNRMPSEWRDRHEVDVNDKRKYTNKERADKIIGLLKGRGTNGSRQLSGNGTMGTGSGK